MSKSGAATTKVDAEHRIGQAPAAAAPARAKRRGALLRFLADPPREVAEAGRLVREAQEEYGDDTDRELADLEAGRHPLQRPKATSPTG